MSNQTQHLLSGEEVVFTSKMHWWIFALPGLFILIGILLSLSGDSGGSTLFYVLGGIGIVIRLANALTSTYLITNKRIILNYGLVKKRTLDLQISRADAIMIEKPFWGRIVNYGTIISASAAGSQKFPFLSNPEAFRRALNEQIDKFTYQ
ncbi:MAG: PH domain-containing protein [Porphyromonas somerae]|uniref:PH domain-containing protein n=1 Tax=Porphyromonas somerae TaxID=322095 RepID=UPI0026EEB674|nr:PH domain-containing protein [Porphyromonas somerae]MDD7557261.1 PH domain-containing protein [Porphyromonas somerae]MDY3119730.1 PH domain-containing protein [Porphyromonas somerae]MDY5814980.1 PH domain-containing protein [Porphyromonas somerae]